MRARQSSQKRRCPPDAASGGVGPLCCEVQPRFAPLLAQNSLDNDAVRRIADTSPKPRQRRAIACVSHHLSSSISCPHHATAAGVAGPQAIPPKSRMRRSATGCASRPADVRQVGCDCPLAQHQAVAPVSPRQKWWAGGRRRRRRMGAVGGRRGASSAARAGGRAAALQGHTPPPVQRQAVVVAVG